MAVAANGVLYVNTWSGTYYRNDTLSPGDSCSRCKTGRATAAGIGPLNQRGCLPNRWSLRVKSSKGRAVSGFSPT